MAGKTTRPYRSQARSEAAERTRRRVLDAGRFLFSRKGIDGTTIAQVAERAGVSVPTVYSLVRSKSGLLQALMHEALFGERFQQAQQALEGVADPVARIGLTARVARAIYEGETAELSVLIKASAFSTELRKSQQSFESLRRKMQHERVEALYRSGRARPGLSQEDAATLLWMYTSREVYHKLVHESGWKPQRYESWLQETLIAALTDGQAVG
jgi:AcrR family transcriptional regulator